MKVLTPEQINAIEPLAYEDYIAWNQKHLVATFCNVSLMQVEQMSETDYDLWLHRAFAYYRAHQFNQIRQQQEAQRQMQAAQEEALIRQQLNGKLHPNGGVIVAKH